MLLHSVSKKLNDCILPLLNILELKFFLICSVFRQISLKADLIKFSGARPKFSEILDFAVGAHEAGEFNIIFFLIFFFNTPATT